MIKVLIFDLDGTLVDTCDIHYIALNKAIEVIAGNNWIISKEDHLSIFNGLNTRRKLQILSENYNLDPKLHEAIFIKKQELTNEYINKLIKKNDNLQFSLSNLRNKGYKIYCATNCIRKIARLILKKLEIINNFDAIFTNEDVTYPKPNCEIYLKCLEQASRSIGKIINPQEVIIFEDSPIGVLAAENSRCHVIQIKSPSELTLDFITNIICLLS